MLLRQGHIVIQNRTAVVNCVLVSNTGAGVPRLGIIQSTPAVWRTHQ